MTKTFKCKVHTGPVQVTQVAEKLRQAWAHNSHFTVTVEGTEHVHVTVNAPTQDTAVMLFQGMLDDTFGTRAGYRAQSL